MDKSRRLNRPLTLAVVVALATASAAAASVTSALIAKAMDSQTNLDLDAPLPEALKQVASQTSVTVDVDPATYELLPWGEQTTVKARTQNCTLRDGLAAVARTLGLVVRLTDEGVALEPSPPLARLGRRATVQELGVLDLMAREPAKLATDRPTVRDLLAAVDGRLAELKSTFAVEDHAPDPVLDGRVVVARNATVAEALAAVADQTSVTWYPWQRSIVVLPKEDQVRTQLNKTLSARYAGVDVGQVVQELAQRAGVDLTVEKGAYERVPAAARSIQLTLDNATVQQALETIGGYTGLGFEVTEKGVHVVGPVGVTAGAPAGAPAGVTVPSTRPVP